MKGKISPTPLALVECVRRKNTCTIMIKWGLSSASVPILKYGPEIDENCISQRRWSRTSMSRRCGSTSKQTASMRSANQTSSLLKQENASNLQLFQVTIISREKKLISSRNTLTSGLNLPECRTFWRLLFHLLLCLGFYITKLRKINVFVDWYSK